ncbi:ProQ/FINO family protein [Azohydromonas aeria]|uniref:ProQ/FINO family protein n=1 Tax=Azohydromonas aeria TaxID=2590212 RepID=UPI0012F81592|nr:ProQ/FINO family protein [Azohydromonas aeria]
MASEPIVRRKRRVVIVADVQPPTTPAVASTEPKSDRPVFKLKSRSEAAHTPADAAQPPVAAPAAPAKPVQEPLSAAERRRRLAVKAAAALSVLAEHYPALFTSARPMAIGTGKVLDAERKAGRLPLGTIPLKPGLSAWAASDAYVEALAGGGPRFNLAGEVAGEVTPEQVAHALKKLHKRRAVAAVPQELT